MFLLSLDFFSSKLWQKQFFVVFLHRDIDVNRAKSLGGRNRRFQYSPKCLTNWSWASFQAFRAVTDYMTSFFSYPNKEAVLIFQVPSGSTSERCAFNNPTRKCRVRSIPIPYGVPLGRPTNRWITNQNSFKEIIRATASK